MKVINLFGQPSAGKSTTAAGLFFEMKLLGLNCELVTEYAKSMVWREFTPKAFQDQLYITAKQNQKLVRLDGKIDYAITDSPLLLGLVYKHLDYYRHFEPFLVELFDSYDNHNFLIKRTKPYNPLGRNQNAEEAEEIHERLVFLLEDLDVPYTEILGDRTAPENILKEVLKF